MSKNNKNIAGKNTENENVVKLAGRWRAGLLSLLFSRFTVIFVLLLLQAAVTVFIWFIFGEYLHKISAAAQTLFGIVIMLILINSSMDSSAKVTWTLLIGVLPVFGGLFYLWTRLEIGYRKLRIKVEQTCDLVRESLPANEEELARLRESDGDSASLALYLREVGNSSVYGHNELKYFPSGESKFQDMLEELKKAEKFILLEYFIIQEGYMWGSILDILIKKAKEGVDVRVMFDGTCYLTKLPQDYKSRLEKVGIKCQVWAPVNPVLTSSYNYRDHRKILVIDGKTAYNGGVNLADEYINLNSRFGIWKDSALRIKGPAVRSYTLMFLQMWLAASRDTSDARQELLSYAEAEPDRFEDAEGFVIPYADSPLDGDKVGEMVYMDMIDTAESYVHITSPYLILDDELKTSLCFAARRGTDVRLILPGIPDKKAVYALAKRYYKDLLEAGVRIYEFTPGFIHAKNFVSDGKKAVVGTINLDYRSLYHHFECATYMSGTAAVAEIEKDFEHTLGLCREVTPESVKNEKFTVKLTGAVVRLLAPLL